MKIYLVRHGQDDESVRGGWSDTPLTESGIQQSKQLADKIANNFRKYNIGKIVSSDIFRAKQTATILAESLNLPLEFNSDFREVNNGDLAGMSNTLAELKYPSLYWRKLEWNEYYPNGESPKEFYERVSKAWEKFTNSITDYDKNILIVTHGGVINIIKCIVDGSEYSNKNKYQGIPSAEIALEIEVCNAEVSLEKIVRNVNQQHYRAFSYCFEELSQYQSRILPDDNADLLCWYYICCDNKIIGSLCRHRGKMRERYRLYRGGQFWRCLQAASIPCRLL